jgi:SAM-dependent methyltransferase
MEALTKSAYLLEHSWEQEPRRLELLEQHADPTSFRRLTATGIRPGWRCLEIGAGRGSVARWLADQVGETGHVTALDLDTSLLHWLERPNVEILEGDVLEIDLPERGFDLIHTRLVLMHIPDRRRALERIVSWLRPGGWLVTEELDSMAIFADPRSDRVELFDGYRQALTTIDMECGRAVLSELTDAGLVDTSADFRVDVVEGATPLAEWEQLSVLALANEALEAETVTPRQIDDHLAQLNHPDYRGFGFSWVGARGRREPTVG